MEWRATNPGQRLEGHPLLQGASRWRRRGRLVAGPVGHGHGRDGALAPVAGAEVAAYGGRVEYRRPGVTEWCVNDTRGIEHGFTLPAGPSPGDGPVVVEEVGVSGGLVPRVVDDARGLVLADAAGAEVARYDGLVAFDALGVDLPARLVLVDGGLRPVVDVAGADYPLTIDPVISTQQAKLTATDPGDTRPGPWGTSARRAR